MSVEFSRFSKEAPASWICVFCLDDSQKDLIAHPGNGEKHPIHLSCLLEWRKRSDKCPTCQQESLLSADLTKIGNEAQKIIRALPFWSKWKNPVFQSQLGLWCHVAGQLLKNDKLSFLGTGLQALVMHRVIQNNSGNLLISRKIEGLCRELLARYSDLKLVELSEAAEFVARYHKTILPWLGLSDPGLILIGVAELKKQVNFDIWVNRFVQFYRILMVWGAVYHGSKIIRRYF